MGKTNEKLQPSVKGAKLLLGKVFKSNVQEKEIIQWINELNSEEQI